MRWRVSIVDRLRRITAPREPSAPTLGPLRRRAEALAVSLVGGALLYCGVRYPMFAPVGMGAGWVVLMAPAVVDRWRAPLIGFFPGLWLSMYILWLPLLKFGWLPYLVIPTVSLAHLLLQPFLAAWLHRVARLPAFVVIPLAVGTAEWTRPLLGFSNFNMYQLGSSLSSAPVLLQAADLVGVLGLSVVWSLPWAWLLDLGRWLASGRPADGRRTVLRGAWAAGTLLVLLIGYGAVQLSISRSEDGPLIAVVQPNARHGVNATPAVVELQERLTRERVPAGVELIAWPENAILAMYEETPRYRQVVERVTRSHQAALLFGAQGRARDPRRFTNSSYLVDRFGRIVGRNNKIILYPFSERRAFRTLERLSPMFERLMTRVTEAGWGSAPNGMGGERPVLMTLESPSGSWTFWTPICYEICYADTARDATRRGSRFFVNLTSEGWLGWGLNNNQMAVSIARAVENRVGVVRVGNTGISCFIRPDGRIDKLLRGDHGRALLDSGVLVHRVGVDRRAPTVYARWGDWIDLLWPLAWLGMFGVAVYRRSLSRARRLQERMGSLRIDGSTRP